MSIQCKLQSFPFKFQHKPPLHIISTSAAGSVKIILHPIKAYYVRLETDETYDLTELFKLYNDLQPKFTNIEDIKITIDRLPQFDDLTRDEIYLILFWYERMGRSEQQTKPFILMQTKCFYKNDIIRVIHVDGLIENLQQYTNYNYKLDDSFRYPAFPIWCNDVPPTCSMFTPPCAFKYLLDMDKFMSWFMSYFNKE
jgi:hypothetical protein